MPSSTKVVLLNAFGGGSLERRTRTLKSGKTSDRYTVTLDAKPLALNFDTKALGRGVAQRITEHLRGRVGSIDAQASPATLRYRESAKKAFAEGKAWAVKRYSGGRTGATPPGQSTRLFNDSGRLANGIVANPTRDNNWVINVPSNRLSAASLGSEAKLVSVVNRLRAYVPEFGDASLLLQIPAIRGEIKAALKSIVTKTSRLRAFTKDLTKTVLQELARAA